jgi:phosphoribosylaminoimidazole-succinocarboxamide synthase
MNERLYGEWKLYIKKLESRNEVLSLEERSLKLKTNKLYEGKATRFYETNNSKELVVEIIQESSGKKREKPSHVKERAKINVQYTSLLFRYLESYNIPTHFIKSVSDYEFLIKRTEILPVQLIVRNIAAGSLVKRYGLDAGKELECPIVEYYLRDTEKQDPMINEDHIISFGYANSEEIKELHRLASKTNVVLKDFFQRRNLKLIDIKLEFGRYEKQILLAGAILPRSCRLHDSDTGENWDYSAVKGEPDKMQDYYDHIKNRFFD